MRVNSPDFGCIHRRSREIGVCGLPSLGVSGRERSRMTEPLVTVEPLENMDDCSINTGLPLLMTWSCHRMSSVGHRRDQRSIHP